MEIEVLKENLDKVVGVASKVSNKNLSLPVLSCVVFVVGGGKAVIKATNLDVSIELNLKAKIIEDGIVAVPAHILTQTISAITDKKLILKTKENNLIIEGDRGVTTITLIDSSEFPTLSHVKEDGGNKIIITKNEITTALKSVSFSASTSSVKPELASVALTLEKGELIAAATDSFRLAEVKIPTKIKNSFDTTLVPARNIPDILRVIDLSDEVELRVGENQCSFVSSFGYITSRTIDGAFPDYQAIIPKGSVAQATCLKEDAIRSFRKISIFTDSFNQVHISFKPSDSVFTVRAVNASVGEAFDRIPAVLEGEDIDINFNAKYITESLSVIAGDSVTFASAGAGKPMIISDTDKNNFTYLVMPMNR